MKTTIYILLLMLSVNQVLHSQKKDSLIQLYPGIGDTLDRFDRDYFGLLQNIKGFEHATFYIRNQKFLVTKAVFIYNGILHDTIAIQYIEVLKGERSKIEQTLLENNKKEYPQRQVTILTKDRSKFLGKLEIFSKNNLYLTSAKHLNSTKSTKQNLLIPVTKLKTITFNSESSVLTSVGWGALAGASIGGMLALASGDDELSQGLFLIAGAVFAVVGGVIGYLIGMSESEDDVVIRIDTQIDLLKLKNYAKYNLGYDKSIEQKYKEFE